MEESKIPKTDVLVYSKKRRHNVQESQQIVGLIQITGKRRKIIDTYANKNAFLSIAPTQIVLKNKIYHLHSPYVL